MKNLLKITLLFIVFVLAKANVCGQQTENVDIFDATARYKGNLDNFNGKLHKSDSIIIITPNNINSDSGLTVLVNSNNSTNQTQYFDIYLNDSLLSSGNFTVNFAYSNKSISVKSADITKVYFYLTKELEITTKITIYKPKVKTGINENVLTKEVQLYSYDNNIVLVNQNSPKNLTVDIYTLTGQLVKTEQVNGLYDKADLQTNLPSGIYVVRVNDGVNQLSKKISINKGR